MSYQDALECTLPVQSKLLGRIAQLLATRVAV